MKKHLTLKLIVFFGLIFALTSVFFDLSANKIVNQKPFDQQWLFQDIPYKKQEKDLYVSTTGNNQNSGSHDEPLHSINLALKQACSGTTVKVLPGTYTEPIVINRSGTAKEPVILESSEEGKAILIGTPTDATDSLLKIDGQSHLVIKGFTFTEFWTDQAEITPKAIDISGQSSHILLDHNTIHTMGNTSATGNAHGIAVYGAQPIQAISITNNQLSDLTLGFSEAIALNGNVKDFLIQGNQLRDLNNIGIDIIGHEGTALNNDFARNGKIINNRLTRISSRDNPAYKGEQAAGGIYVDGGQHVLIQDNLVEYSDIGIEVASEHQRRFAKFVDVSRNHLSHNDYVGIALGGYNKTVGGSQQITVQ